MEKKCALGIFAKTIGLSPTKTRLQADYSQAFVEDYYRRAIDATASLACHMERTHNWQSYWLLAEREGGHAPLWQGYKTRYSGGVDDAGVATTQETLGERLDASYRGLRETHDTVVLIGSDTPHMPLDLLDRLTAYLPTTTAEKRCIIGPALDGGFYLFAANCDIPSAVWTQVAYSSRTTLLELMTHLQQAHIAVSLLATLADTDTKRDLLRAQDSMMHTKQSTVAQQALLTWLRSRVDMVADARAPE